VKVLVTGASGFVGHALARRIVDDRRLALRAAFRRRLPAAPPGEDSVLVGDLSEETDGRAAVRGCEAVVHTAARVHVMRESGDPLPAFRRVNVDGTLRLARHAVDAGVRRFVYVSSVKVNGEVAPPERPFTVDDEPAPVDAYGISKLEAEQGLRRLAADTGLEVVIIRPVLVYGPGVKANFEAMMRWLQRGVPLPLGAIHNRRSILALANLVDLLICAVTHPRAANRTFLASDGEDLSTTDLLRRAAAALGCRAHLIPVPAVVLVAAASVAGRRELATRLCGSLCVDIDATRRQLDWFPPSTVDEALARTASHFLRHDEG
jgi:Nucleoside-diphosphate-sugar epimerases